MYSKNNTVKLLPFCLLLIFICSSCSEEVNRSLKPIPNSFGELNQIIVVSDEEIWKGRVGDSLRYDYSGPYPILPQPEPIFDLAHFTPYELASEPTRRELKTYLVIGDLNDEDSPTSKLIVQDIGSENARKAKEDKSFNSTVGRDKWAKGQQIIYQFGYGEEELINGLKKNFSAIAQRVKNIDRKRIEQTVFQSGNDLNLMESIQATLGINIRIPQDYFEAGNEGRDFKWLRMETEKISSNILIKKMPYTDQSQLTKLGIKSVRDTIGKYISSEIQGSYMKINDFDLPMFVSVKTVNGKYAIEARGIWEMENDYMGGAFLSYLIHNEEQNELLFIDGFIYAPSKKKRNLIQHLEFILNTTEFLSLSD